MADWRALEGGSVIERRRRFSPGNAGVPPADKLVCAGETPALPGGPANRHLSGLASTADWRALDEHLARLDVCRLCPTVVPPPILARPEVWPRILLVGQAPGPREVIARKPFAHTAGQRMFAWFERLGVSEDEFRRRVRMVAVIRCFPGRAPKGGDRPPSPLEIATCAPHLERELDILQPATVLAVGKNAIEWFLGAPAPLETRIGRSFPVERRGLAFEVIPLPHPSGRSTWLIKPENQKLLEKALRRVKKSAGWQETFKAPG